MPLNPKLFEALAQLKESPCQPALDYLAAQTDPGQALAGLRPEWREWMGQALGLQSGKAYDLALAEPRKAYSLALAEARKAWNLALAEPGKAYDLAIAEPLALAEARKAYDLALAEADKAWNLAVAEPRMAYDLARAEAWKGWELAFNQEISAWYEAVCK